MLYLSGCVPEYKEEPTMAKYKHLTLNERTLIQSMLTDKCSISQIANTLGKDISTISKEIKAHTTIKNMGAAYVCNGCGNRPFCSLDKHLYFAAEADMCYRSSNQTGTVSYSSHLST